jgi:hypothetical protein
MMRRVDNYATVIDNDMTTFRLFLVANDQVLQLNDLVFYVGTDSFCGVYF